MTIFWLAAIGMLLGVAGFVYWPLLAAKMASEQAGQDLDQASREKTKAKTNPQRSVAQSLALQQQRNVEIFKERLSELEAEQAQGTLDAASFAQLKLELEKSLLKDVALDQRRDFKVVQVGTKHWLIATLMFLSVIIWSLGLYAVLGRSDDYNLRLAMQAQGTLKNLGEPGSGSAAMANADTKPIDLNKAIELLKTKIKEDPTNVGKWYLLANSYAATDQYDKAAETFVEIEKLTPKTSPDYAAVKGSYAQVLYLADGEKITPRVKSAVAEALTIDANESNALTLKGVEAFEQGQYKQAIAHWEQAKAKANPRLLAQFIEPSISAAQEKLGIAPSAAPKSAQAATAKITVQVDIDPALKAKVSPDQVVFVFARPTGSKMPLAAERLTVKDLPATVVLDDSKSPMPTAKLSSVAQVELTARISLSGQPMLQDGDLFATENNVAVGADTQVKLLINQVAGAASSSPAPASSAAPAAASVPASLTLKVDIDPALKAKLDPEQSVFIFAKAPGGKMPLAVERLKVKDLPAEVTLDDSKAAMPTATLSSVEKVDLTARVSLSGGAIAQAGDLFASQEQVEIRTLKQPVNLLINQVMP